ncbi:MAG TPA: ribokinase [Cyclobacteriaceae bacterium]|nr:ribokinase [Cyclobacteriaceae bacterium]
MRICVIGSSNTDMVVRSSRIPKPGETILGGQFLMNAGGKGANQAVAAARLGGEVMFVARVGSDLFGREAKKHFQAEKINTEFVLLDDLQPSGVALINVDEHGENSIAVAPGANAALHEHQVDLALHALASPAIMLLQLEIPVGTVEYAIRNGSKAGHRIILNPAPAQQLSKNIFPYISIITPNESEATLLTGIPTSDTAGIVASAKTLHQWGVDTVIITLGDKGAYIHGANHQAFVPAPRATPVDTTGAGDCFNGALAVALSEGLSIEQAAAFACAAASQSVSRMGAQQAMPFRHELI